jgi:hypothetical protein
MRTEEQSSKKAYKAPTLRVYGNLTELTMSSGMKGNLDGGKGNNKTGK